MVDHVDVIFFRSLVVFMVIHLPVIDGFLSGGHCPTSNFQCRSHPDDLIHRLRADDSSNDEWDSEEPLYPLLKMASAHFASQALYAAVRLEIPDILYQKQEACSIDELCEELSTRHESDRTVECNGDALLRMMRLLTSIDVVSERELSIARPINVDDDDKTSLDVYGFTLTTLGKSFVRKNNPSSMAPCILHWMEAPLWNSWLGLTDYILEGPSSSLPFERANDGVSSDDWYHPQDHPESLKHANDFVKLIYERELKAVANSYDWSLCKDQRIVDVGGHNGRLAQAILQKEPSLKCYCLDLPEVIESLNEEPDGVTLVAGNVLDPTTIPDCEVIVMKHFLDRSLFDDAETVTVLESCKTALLRSKSEPRRIVVADAVLPDCGSIASNELGLYLDALYMLVGRERQRTRREWEDLADAAGLKLVGIESTDLPTSSLLVFETR